MCLQQACQQFVTMLLFQGCHSQLVELQDDNKLLEQLLTSLLSTKQVVTKQASKQVVNLLQRNLLQIKLSTNH
jgi:hypothetical protein